MEKKQNLMLDAPQLNEEDLRSITWWQAGFSGTWLKCLTLQEVMLYDKQKLKIEAHRYFRYHHGNFKTSRSKTTYRKLFGKYTEEC